MSNRVAVIDYGLCNVDSVRRGVEECGGDAVLVQEGSALERVDRIILPGVGAFAPAMQQLEERDLRPALEDQVLGSGIPFLGICLGLHLLATVGTEGGQTKGLGWIGGEVQKLVPTGTDRRLPHVGWNEVVHDGSLDLLDGIPSGRDFYFVHSYHLVCDAEADVAATTPYCGGFASVVNRDLIFGVQFHPEKSQRNGLKLLDNFLAV